MKIALLGPLVPLINPVRAAEEIAMIDALSHGRVVVLFLRGTPNEHATYGTNPAETREITQEGVQLILRAWTEPQPFGWEGKYFRYRTISVWPRTVQDPHPPVFYSGNSDELAEFAGKHAPVAGRRLRARAEGGAAGGDLHAAPRAPPAGSRPTTTCSTAAG